MSQQELLLLHLQCLQYLLLRSLRELLSGLFAAGARQAQAGEFTNLKGMIYFTDGRGIFPEKKPDYDAAFVFLDDGYDPPDVPVWAIKLVLQSEEI